MDESTFDRSVEELVMTDYEKLVAQVREFTIDRMEHYFKKERDAPVARSFRIEADRDNPIGKIVRREKLNGEEQLLLSIVLMPHLDPDFFSGIIQRFLPNGGNLPIFGCVKGKHHRGFIPTGETAIFIIAGTDLKKRLEVAALLKSSRLINKGILSVEPVEDGEPEISGKLVLSKEYAELFLTGKVSLPSFSPDFPAQKIDTEQEWDDLVLTDEVIAQIEELKSWIEHNDRLMNEWGMRKKLKPGYRVLFHGPPGTGKTLTASLLGKYTDRPVFRVDLSTIVSKYIGETEKNLSKLFDKAENKDWILFFDEADALFGKRTEVSDSHDRYANQEVSYLLQRVEMFSGLVILSTNYKSNLDDAFVRRFNSIIKFPFPDPAMREKLWKKSFSEKVTIGRDVDFKQIASAYKLAGGSIINAVHQASLKTISENSDSVSGENILHGIRREVEKEGKVFKPLVLKGK
ncbi:MAG: ATP-binding protein [Balneolaceae bacterium]|nr:ATP-binding protein [Balneolaceae bacterium]